MNRIILIGNGFDLAHDLDTSYKDFINDFWKEEAKKIRRSGHLTEYGSRYNNDGLIYLRTDVKKLWDIVDNREVISSLSDLEQQINSFRQSIYKPNVTFEIKNKFLEHISRQFALKTWVDIENEYHLFLCDCFNEDGTYHRYEYRYLSVKELNKDFRQVQNLLEAYLIKVSEEKKNAKEEIKEIVFSDFVMRDFTEAGLDKFAAAEYLKLTYHFDDFESISCRSAKIHEKAYHNLSKEEMIDQLKSDLSWRKNASEFYDFTLNNLLFLNFNYTDLEELYLDEDLMNQEVIHIHGELNNKDNPIIFGYGDELGEDYAKLQNLNDNEYLENIKSIKYLETDNYKRLLSFIESEPYQIFVFGHSCGNSDRTLLNTIFEHENCNSIKVYYYQESATKDHYSDVIRNISRNFNNKASMREKVVNKTYCKPLTPFVEKEKRGS